MHRAYKFIEDAEHEILSFMEKDITRMSPKELDLIVGLCDLHEGACEFVALLEKKGKHGHDRSQYGSMTGWDDENPRRRRR